MIVREEKENGGVMVVATTVAKNGQRPTLVTGSSGFTTNWNVTNQHLTLEMVCTKNLDHAWDGSDS